MRGIFGTAGGPEKIELWKEAATRLFQETTRLLDPGNGDAKIVVVGVGGPDEVTQVVVLKDFPPGEIGDGIGGSGDRRGTKLDGKIDLRTVIVRADGTAGQEEHRKRGA